MGFADAYLLKAGLRDKLIETEPHPDLKIIVTIPVHQESGLERCLDSFFQCSLPGFRAEVLILINASADADESILKQNLVTYDSVLVWIADHPHPSVNFHVWLDHSFTKKEAGVGMARKILMDEAVRRFSKIGIKDGIIASMDADAVVEPNYLEALVEHFRESRCDGCSVYFEHPLLPEEVPQSEAPIRTEQASQPAGDTHKDEISHPKIPSYPGEASHTAGTDHIEEPSQYKETLPSDNEFPPSVYEAITRYELHLRYYLQSVRSTGYPNAFHTVGSSFAVNAEVYCMEGGMNRRQGGEDFYFIQKVAQRGHFSECNTTRVVPSPRPSSRVPFGTGPVVERLINGDPQLTTYHPQPFRMLRALFDGLETLYSEAAMDHFMKTMPEVLLEFLETQDFGMAVVEIRKNSASYPAFRKRFWRWFNMFRIMKFLHHAREKGYPDVPVDDAALEFLHQINSSGIEIPAGSRSHSNSPDPKSLLRIFRQIDRSNKPSAH